MRLPESVRIGCSSNPGADVGTRKNVRPWCLATSGSVRVSRNTHSDSSARLVKIFWPSMRQPSPSRTARVRAAATSDPESGSEYPSAISDSPGQQLREDDLPLHLVADVGDDRRQHRADAQPVVRRARQLELAEQHRQLLGAAPATAERLGQRLFDPALVGHGPVQAPVVHGAGVVRALAHLVGEDGGDERAHLVAELLGAGGRREVHVRPPTPGDRAVPEVGEPRVLAAGFVEHVRPALGPPVEELDVVLLHEAVATVVVQRPLGRVLRPFGAEQERHRGELRGVVALGVERPRRLAREQLRAVERDCDVGETVLQALERTDGHTELLAFGHVGDRDRQRAEPEADERGGGEHPPFVDRVRVEVARRGARREHGSGRDRVGRDRPVGERCRREVGHEVTGR